jgi:hypothetical protein
MRIVFGALSLLIVLAIVGVLAKKQLGSAGAGATTATSTQGVTTPTGTPKQQVDQFKQSVDKAMQQSRPVTDETK